MYGQTELLKYLKDISHDECTSYILYIHNTGKISSDAYYRDKLAETVQEQCITTFSGNITNQTESLELFKVIHDIIQDDVEDYEKTLETHNIHEGEEFEFGNLTFLPKLGTLVKLTDLQYLVQGIQSCALGDYVAVEVHSSTDENEIVEDANNVIDTSEYPPAYRHARIKKLIEDHVNNFEKKYEVEIEPRKFEIISGVYLYRFSKPPMNDIRIKNNDDVNTKQIMLTNIPTTQEEEAHRFTCLEALKEQIDKDIQSIKPLAEKERSTAIRRLMLDYHPDKHRNQTVLYTAAFQYLQQCLDRLLNRSNTTTSQTQAGKNKNFSYSQTVFNNDVHRVFTVALLQLSIRLDSVVSCLTLFQSSTIITQ
ncbi:unnamed protein product [Didymodactylos carnosus]|uniref:Uncharacterized protein n=2 Tax=Didymodactylos carnosus TaxID=1234261 RepID=A0A8S2VKV8_9BILA|nr:unnamed protein product [Didymodactylos carnosus]